MTKRLWSLNALAVELDSDRRTVANALKRVPADGEQAGHPAWFILTAIRALWPAPDANGEILDPAQERARKDRALAEQTEMRNAHTRGEMVRIEEVMEPINRLFRGAREHLLSLPTKVASNIPTSSKSLAESVTRDLLYEAMDAFTTEMLADQADKLKSKRGRL